MNGSHSGCKDQINGRLQTVKTDLTAIKADKLCFTYPYEKKPAINGLTFSLEKGESLAVMGSNGSGKSTLIRLL